MEMIPRIRNLYLVREIYQSERISNAAQACNLSQPAATQSLIKVEKMLGVHLFERRPKGMIPTEVGQLFFKRLDRILGHFERGTRRARKRAAREISPSARENFHRFCSPVQLRALLAVEKAGNFSQAALDLGVSQPGVHRAVRELGAIAGFALFEQTRGGVVLSAAAEEFTFQARLGLSEFQQAIYEINETLGRDVTRINVGSMPLSRASILPAAIDDVLSKVGPAVQINCVDARYPALLKDLRFGSLDFLIGALRTPAPTLDIEQETLFVDKLVVVVRPEHPLTRWETLSLQDTLVFPWLAPPKDTPSGRYLFENLAINEMPDTPVRVVSSSLVLIQEMLHRGDYVTIVSERQIAGALRAGTLTRLPIDLANSDRSIGLTIRSGWTPTPIQKLLLDAIRNQAYEPFE